MGEIRVYEAARRLGMDTMEFMDHLAAIGTQAQSPISFISQEVFEQMTASIAAAPKGERKMDQTIKPSAENTANEKDKGRLSLVTPAAEPSQAPGPISHETDEDEDTAEPVAAAKDDVPAWQAPAERPASSGGPYSAIHYVTIGIAGVALLSALVLGAVVSRHTSELSRISDASGVMKTEIATLSSGVKTNQSLINDTRLTVTDLKNKVELSRRIQTRDALAERAASIEELSAVMPAGSAEKMRSISAQLNALAASM
ncbi:MAG: hypothetical protein HZB29_11440 [Nitrospinae bacterium]|nr:hypothetical protein [Nitrospinota bacterium]